MKDKEKYKQKAEKSQMKTKEQKVFMKPGKNNKEDRENFIKYWANYIKTHSDKEWSSQQKVLIDSQISEYFSFFLFKFPKNF